MNRRIAILLLTILLGVPCLAHVGSPDVYFQGQAGPYQLAVTIRTPQMIPGVAEIEIRSSTAALRQVKIVPLYGAKRRKLQATLDETQSEVELFQARRDTLRNMVQFATGATAGGMGSGTLSGEIEELARTVPSVNANTKETDNDKNVSANNNANSMAVAARERKEEPSGILDIIANLFTLHRKIKSLEDDINVTDSLSQASKALRSPLTAKIRELTQHGDQLAAQADSSDPAALAQERKDLDALTSQYKQLSASMLPLGKQNILLDLYKRSTTNWRNAVKSQYDTELKGLTVAPGRACAHPCRGSWRI